MGDDLVTFVDVFSPVGWKYGLVGWKYGLVTFALLLLPSVFSLVVCFGFFLEWQLQNYLGLYFMVSVMKMNIYLFSFLLVRFLFVLKYLLDTSLGSFSSINFFAISREDLLSGGCTLGSPSVPAATSSSMLPVLIA